MGDLAPAAYYGLWIKRVVTASATAYGSDTAILGWRGETTAT
jgi:hypothetical protein